MRSMLKAQMGSIDVNQLHYHLHQLQLGCATRFTFIGYHEGGLSTHLDCSLSTESQSIDELERCSSQASVEDSDNQSLFGMHQALCFPLSIGYNQNAYLTCGFQSIEKPFIFTREVCYQFTDTEGVEALAGLSGTRTKNLDSGRSLFYATMRWAWNHLADSKRLEGSTAAGVN